MELNAYIGRAGTGKSKAIIEEIKEKMKQDPLGDPIVLIAPTQNTFQLEQAFVNDKTLNGSLRTEVLHFERLRYRVFQEVGGLMEQQLSKAGTEMMIYDIIQQHQSELRLYQSQVKYYGFSEKLYEQIQDFKGKYPKQIWSLFFSEMWERFCFYAMRGMLTYFMVYHLFMDEKTAQLQYGATQAFVLDP